jgi:ketosteroid isomerase-like protein
MSKFSTCSTVVLYFVATAFVTAACRESADVETQESEGEVDVVDAILDRTTQWAEANRRRDTAAVLDMYINSDELRHAENGVIFPSYEALAEFVEDWYDATEEMDLVWEQRAVVRLSADAATITGIFRYEAKRKSGEVWAGRNVFTGVFVRRGGSWKLVHGHESSVPASEIQ